MCTATPESGAPRIGAMLPPLRASPPQKPLPCSLPPRPFLASSASVPAMAMTGWQSKPAPPSPPPPSRSPVPASRPVSEGLSVSSVQTLSLTLKPSLPVLPKLGLISPADELTHGFDDVKIIRTPSEEHVQQLRERRQQLLAELRIVNESLDEAEVASQPLTLPPRSSSLAASSSTHASPPRVSFSSSCCDGLLSASNPSTPVQPHPPSFGRVSISMVAGASPRFLKAPLAGLKALQRAADSDGVATAALVRLAAHGGATSARGLVARRVVVSAVEASDDEGSPREQVPAATCMAPSPPLASRPSGSRPAGRGRSQ